MEVRKAYERRVRAGYFENYCRGKGIDIGAGADPLKLPFEGPEIDLWDQEFGDGDATHMEGVPDGVYDFIHGSHVLEHLHFPHLALRNWWRILKPGGHLLINVPHRDLYEKKLLLPSSFNFDHKTFWLPERNEPPHTFGLRPLIEQELPEAQIISLSVEKEGWVESPPGEHSVGEYAIEAVVRKPG